MVSIYYARVVELVDTRDLKSLDRNIVPVQVRPRVPTIYLLKICIKKHINYYLAFLKLIYIKKLILLKNLL